MSRNYSSQRYEQSLARAAVGRSYAGKIYLPVEPAPPTTARADAHNAEAVDSKLPKAEASSAAGNFTGVKSHPILQRLGLTPDAIARHVVSVAAPLTAKEIAAEYASQESMRATRARYKAQGLNSNGLPYRRSPNGTRKSSQS